MSQRDRFRITNVCFVMIMFGIRIKELGNVVHVIFGERDASGQI